MRLLLSLRGSLYGSRERRLAPYVVGKCEYIEFADGQLTKCRFSAWSGRVVTTCTEKKEAKQFIKATQNFIK